MENIRVSELAKELGLTSKEVIEKFAQISINVKSHSNTVNPMQVSKLKDFIAGGSKLPSKKPKAFVVKKSKIKKEEQKAEEKAEKVETPKKSGVQIVRKAERPAEPEKKEEPVIKKEAPTPIKRVEIVKPQQPKSRLEIVKRAPIKRVEIDKKGKPVTDKKNDVKDRKSVV